jgi:hypothetical protein
VNYSGAAPGKTEAEEFELINPGAPDSPVNYSGAAPGKPEAEEFELIHPGAPDCPVRQTREHFGFLFAPFF